MVMRFEDWPTRLDAAMVRAHSSVMDWATFNCCLLPADAIEAMTGVDPAKPFRKGTYKTARGALGALKRFLGPDYYGLSMDALVEAVGERICTDAGFAEIGPLYAQRGDVVLVDAPQDTGPAAALGVCLGAHVVVPGEHGGLEPLPITGVRRAWRVP